MGFPLSDLPLFIAQARSILPSDVLIQVPPNLVCGPDSTAAEEGNCSNKGSRGDGDMHTSTSTSTSTGTSDFAKSNSSRRSDCGENAAGTDCSSGHVTRGPNQSTRNANENANEKSNKQTIDEAGTALRNDFLLSLLEAGASDLGGISPLDEVNPSYRFQSADTLRAQLKFGDFELVQRLPVHERHFHLLSEKVRGIISNEYSDFSGKFV